MDVYKLYGTGTTSASAVASLDIRRDGFIVAVLGTLTITAADALNDGFTVEASFASTSGIGSNDTSASFFAMTQAQGFLTSGGGPAGVNLSVSGLAVPVRAGERLYLHAQLTGNAGPSHFTSIYLFVMEAAGPGRADVRLR